MSRLVDAWQAGLRAEQQAVFGYGLLGPHLSDAGEITAARTDEDAHNILLTQTAAAITAAGAEPAEPAADYPALYPVRDAAGARALALRLEEQAAAAWRYLFTVAVGSPEATAKTARAAAQDNLTASAVRALRWRGKPVPFPGI